MRKVLLIFLILQVGCVSVAQKNTQDAANVNAKIGLIYLQKGDIVFAKKKLLLALMQAPKDPEVQLAVGYFFGHTGEPEIASQYYLAAIKSSEKKCDAWYAYAVFLYAQNKFAEAKNYFLLAARDATYLYTAKAYCGASKSTLKLKEFARANYYGEKARIQGVACRKIYK